MTKEYGDTKKTSWYDMFSSLQMAPHHPQPLQYNQITSIIVKYIKNYPNPVLSENECFPKTNTQKGSTWGGI